MKKRTLGVLCFILGACLLMTGCGLFQQNRDRYLNRTVATVNDDIVITKEDLIVGYNQYGSTLINSYGYSQEQAIEYVIDLLIDKQVMLKKAHELFPTLSDKEESKLWHDTYEAMNEALKGYEDAVKADWDIKDSDSSETAGSDTDSSTEAKPYEAYEKKAEIYQDDDDLWQIRAIEEEDDLKDVEVIEGGADKFLSTYRVISRQDVSDEALKRYIKDLKKNEEGRTFKGEDPYSDNSVLIRAINNVYDQIEDNFYLEKLKIHLVSGTNVTTDMVLNKYKEELLAKYVKYSVGGGDFSADILSSADAMYYVPQNCEGEFFYVSHFLVKFDAEEQAIVDDLKAQLDEGYINQQEYDMGVEAVVANMNANIYDDEGKKTEDEVLVKDLIASLNADMAGKSEAEKAEVFRQYLYKYNEDTAFNNSEYAYVIGNNDSKMVESFTNAARELHSPSVGVKGKIGDLSAIVPSEYGVHILMYAGEVENLFALNSSNANDFALNNADIKVLYDTLLNQCNNKTVFDKIYDSVFKDSYSTFESAYLQSLKKDATIKVYKKSYKDLLG